MFVKNGNINDNCAVMTNGSHKPYICNLIFFFPSNLNCLTATVKMHTLQNCWLKFCGWTMQNHCPNQTCPQRLLSPSLGSLTSSKSSSDKLDLPSLILLWDVLISIFYHTWKTRNYVDNIDVFQEVINLFFRCRQWMKHMQYADLNALFWLAHSRLPSLSQ